MPLNQFGAGFEITAKDAASGVFGSVGRNFSGMAQKADKNAKTMQSAMARIGKGFALIGIGLGSLAPFGIALNESQKLGKAIAEVATLTDEATFPVAKMTELVKGLAGEYGEQATGQASALYQTISAGFGDAAKAAEVLTSANKLAVGGVTEVETAVDGLTNVLNTYASANLVSADVSDAFFVAVKAGKTTVGELSQQIGRVAPGAEALGIEFDQLLAAMAAITTKGINTAQASSGLAAAMANIVKPTTDATAEAKRLGIEFSAAALRSKGLKGFMDSITGSANYTEDSISQLFGSIEAFKTMTALASNEGAKFNEVLEQMDKRAGATDAAVEKMKKTFDFQRKILGATVNNIMTEIGDSVKELVTPVLKVINTIAKGISKFAESLPPGIKQAIVGIIGAIGGFVTVVGVVMVLSGAISMLGVTLGGLIATIGVLMVAAVPLTIMFAGMAVAIYAVFRAFKKNTGGITTSWKDMVGKVVLAWQGMMAIIKGDKFSDELNEQLDKAENKGVVGFLNKFRWFVDKVKSFWNGLVEGFEAGVDALAQSPAMQNLKAAMSEIIGLFTGEGEVGGDKDVLEKWKTEGVEAGRELAKLGEIALEAMTSIIDMGYQAAAMIKGLDVGEIKESIMTFLDVFNKIWTVVKFIHDVIVTMVNILKVGAGIVTDLVLGVVSAVKIAASAINLVSFNKEDRQKGLAEIKAEIENIDFFGATRKAAAQIPKDIISDRYNPATGGFDLAPQRTSLGPQGAAALTGFVPPPKAERTPTFEGPVGPFSAAHIGALRKDKELMDMTIANARKGIEIGMKQAAKADKKGKKDEVNELKILIMQQNDKLNALQKIADRPIEVKIDGEKVAVAVKDSGTNKGDRNYDEGSGLDW